MRISRQFIGSSSVRPASVTKFEVRRAGSRLALLAAVAAVASLAAPAAHAQWAGLGAGGVGNEISTATNWTGETLNGSFNSVTTGATLSLSAAVTFNPTFAFASGGITLNVGDGVNVGTVIATGVTLSPRFASPNTVTFSATTTLRAGGDINIGGGSSTGTGTVRPLLVLNGPVDLQTSRLNINGGDVVINGLVSGTNTTSPLRYGLTTDAGVLTLTNPNNSFANPVAAGGFGSLVVNSAVPIANTGSPSAMGAGNAFTLNNNSLTLSGQTAEVFTNRTVNAGNSSARINNNGVFPLNLTGTIVNTVTNGTLNLGGTFAGTNSISGTVTNTATNRLSVAVQQGIWRLSNDANTFDGNVNVNARLQFTSITNYGQPSSLGTMQSGSFNGTITLNNGALEFVGTTPQVTNRDFVIINNFSQISNSSTASLTLNGNLATNGTNAATAILAAVANSTNTINGLISNGGATTLAITKGGAGTWVLANDSNSFNGTVLVTGGTLRATSLRNYGQPSSLGTGGTSNLVNLNNGALALSPLGSISSNRNIVINQSATILNDALDPANTVTLTGTVSGFSNTGTLTLRGSNPGTNTVSGLISNGTAPTLGLAKTDASTWALLSPSNSFTGAIAINQGTVIATKLADGGQPSSIGAANANPLFFTLGGVFAGGSSTLNYIGSGDSTNRMFTIGEGGSIIANNGTGTLHFTNVNPLTTAGNPLVVHYVGLGGNFAGVINTFAPGIPDIDPIATPPAVVGLRKFDAGTWELTQIQSFTGPVQILGGTLRAADLQNGGTPSSIGAASSAAGSLIFGGGGNLAYVGTGTSTDRRFTLGVGGGSLESSGSGPIAFTSTDTVSFTGSANTARTLTLTGSNTGDNLLAAGLANNGNGALSVAKSGPGTWTVAGSLSYTGNTTVTGGSLKINSPLRPVTGSLVVTGPWATARLDVSASNSDYTRAVDVSSIVVGSLAQSGVSSLVLAPTDRTTAKASVVVTSAVSIDAASGFLDLGNNDLIVRGGLASLPALRSLVATWLSTGNTGLGASAAAPFTSLAVFPNADSSGNAYFTTYDGVTSLTAADAIVKHTYVGDTNLDGKLDANDLADLLEGLSTGATGWQNGDLNYDGSLTTADYAAFAAAYAYYTNPANNAPDLGNGQALGSSSGAIPEPGALALFLAAAPALTRRRRTH